MPSLYKKYPGWFDFQDIYLQAVEEAFPTACFVEIGFYLGRSACFMAEAIKESGKYIRFYSIDPLVLPGQREQALRNENEMAKNGLHLTLLDMESHEAATMPYWSDRESIQFVFIDGSHKYADVLQDLNDWWPKVVPGGVLAGHDYLDFKNSPDVKPAVDLFVKENNLAMEVRGTSFWIRKNHDAR